MINRFQLLRNVGQFDSVDDGAEIPLAKVALIYAENGRGKTTISAILRSVATGDPLPITERRRLSSTNAPHVVLNCDDGPPHVVFQDNVWNRTLPNVVVFDDVFVDENICSGLDIEPEHRQNLHEWILGAPGVSLNQQLRGFVSLIEVHNHNLRNKAAEIPIVDRHGLTVEQFCALPTRPEIDAEILAAERTLAAAIDQESIRATSVFDTLSLPDIDLAAIEGILQSDLATLEAASIARVQSHFAGLGGGGETWVGEGMGFMSQIATTTGSAVCPFCAQALTGSLIIDHYRTYFSEEYLNLRRAVTDALQQINRTHSGEVIAAFERTVRVTGERRAFWAKFGDMPPFSVDTAAIARDWQTARDSIASALTAKQLAPLDQITLPDEARVATEIYVGQRQRIAVLNEELQQGNVSIFVIKEQAQEGSPTAIATDLERLRAVKARFTPNTASLCIEYLTELAAKTETETHRDAARAELETYRNSVFPGFETAINLYLQRFNAGFRVAEMTPENTRGGSTCTYNVIINNTPVPIAGQTPPGDPAFRNTLSAGDRNTLALAFFFASLDQNQGIEDKIIVIDDPITSLDDHRSLATVQEMRRIARRADQVIIMSHDKPFLCRIWEDTDRTLRSALQITRSGETSTLRPWGVDQDRITEHDRRHALLREYLSDGTPDSREVAQATRPLLEAYFRVTCPNDFPPGQLLGVFLDLCRQRAGTPNQILSTAGIQELQDLTEYANKFHHDTNPAWDTETINDGELRSFVQRALTFTGPP